MAMFVFDTVMVAVWVAGLVIVGEPLAGGRTTRAVGVADTTSVD